MSKNLVIVESPTKAKTISRFLNKKYQIESSNGHVRDLPKSKMGIDTEKNFTPQYVVPKKSSKRVNELKKIAKKADMVYFATDEDREGEAISWHLMQIFKSPKDQVKRIAFHEITKGAVEEALKNPRAIDLHLVDAQQARRVLDRLVGYELSPFLWKKIRYGLSAGRVQSVAVRLIVEREREIKAFKPQEYWQIEGEFKKVKVEDKFKAKLLKIDNKVLDKFAIKNEKEAKKILKELRGTSFQINDIKKRESRRNPLAPFTTSTLQQEANRFCHFSAKQTMMFAQQLYEGINIKGEGSVGLITYMRTDSVNLADKFLNEASGYIKNKFGSDYLPSSTRKFKAKSKLAQEAHEAIRPTDPNRDPESVKEFLDEKQFKLYQLIWQRALASQMKEALIDSTIVDTCNKDKKYLFRTTGSIIKFDGFLKIYPNNRKDEILPELKKDEEVEALKIDPQQKFTEPAARYSEASLVKALEENGIGRPSTYAPTISTIVERQYVEKIDRRLKPTDIGCLVNDVLVKHFPKIVDIKFTAHLEDDLDEIAQGKKEWEPVISEFYKPFKDNLMQKEKEVSKKELTEEKTDEVCEQCGKPMVIKMGRYGKFLSCTGYPDCKNAKPLNVDQAGGPPEPETTDEKCEKCGKPMVIRQGKFGKFMSCSGYPDCKNTKPISLGVKCPECGKGEICERRSRAGKTFYSCNKYPECKFALWSKPTGENCPDCKSLLVYGAKGTARCSNKECGFTKELEEKGNSN